MNSSDIPSRISKAFGVNGLRNVIATTSSATTDNGGVATFDKGFPPITMQPLSAGGIPPSGKDMNGVLYSVTLQQQWQNSGMGFGFNTDFSTEISGYPRGALLPSSSLNGYWLNTLDGNSVNPESASGASTGWVPLSNYGYTNITGLSSSSVTLTSLQASKERLILSGVLTSNINLVLPPWTRSWVIQNNCTGNYSVLVKTQSGAGVSIAAGLTGYVYGDGINILSDAAITGLAGRLLDVKTFTSSGTYTPSKGARKIRVRAVGGGGGGGGVPSQASNTQGTAQGGECGAYIEAMVEIAGQYSIPVVIGTAGSGGLAGNNPGLAGGATSLGGFLSTPGGTGGASGGASSVIPFAARDASGELQPTFSSSVIALATKVTVRGAFPRMSLSLTNSIGGMGGSTPFGDGGSSGANDGGKNGNGYGSGGGGAAANAGTSAQAGGSGRPGYMVIEEFS